MNYAAHNKELHHSLKLSEPTIFMKSDSSLLKGDSLRNGDRREDRPAGKKHCRTFRPSLL